MNLKTNYPVRLKNNLNDIKELSAITQMESVNSDLIKMFIGKHINSGFYRSVFEFNPNPDKYVVKIEHDDTNCNTNEFLIWNEVSGLHGDLAWVKDWFAPILWMSPNGKITIQERTTSCHNEKFYKKELPKEIPVFFSDVKDDNFGWLNNKFVCHDYGFINRFIKYNSKFRKANW